MSKPTKFLHALRAHVELAVEYDPQNMEQIAVLNTQIREAVRKLPGFVDVKFQLGKIPAPAVIEAAEPADQAAAHPLDLPASLKK